MAATFLLGFDVGCSRHSSSLEDTLGVLERMNHLMDEAEVQRTYFMLGNFVEEMAGRFNSGELDKYFGLSSPLADVQSHTYSHRAWMSLPTRPDVAPASTQEISAELDMARGIIKDKLGRDVIGVRTPYGYYKGLEEYPEIVGVLVEAEYRYVSSDLRDKDWGICPGFQDGDALRQPRDYWGWPLLEIPSHGWQDSAFAGSKTAGVPQFDLWEKSKLEVYAISHYGELMLEAKKISKSNGNKEIFVGSCFHPFAMASYDKDLRILSGLIDFAKKNEVHVAGYSSLVFGAG
ncbi:MAG TPA: polysaccharide deacetylase family protein [Nanoarchaeota archaeon]|nr:MAG: hypothetical protein QT01_C0007G0009 [archaeon GW2011_AR6]MBS3083131.1 polysaccharide deacetylase family protein [Candidatus Pacearchaeota archaeon]HIH17778.1 polysaccharide deacetylase family protein [Nanoarchaeota archaeon]HIH34032.1 polysaccharide deacetylase family protein [Nanoarchaeota archaeon]HIH51646.1 polysaccharide deacetylase family protein [Nanoarchaeota archaeon]